MKEKYAVIPLDVIHPDIIDVCSRKNPEHYLIFLKNLWHINSGESLTAETEMLFHEKKILEEQHLFNVSKIRFRRKELNHE